MKPAWPRIRPESYGLLDRVIFALFVFGLPSLFAAGWAIFRDGDVSWHVAAGRWILEHGRVPRTDPFSVPMAGQPWVSHEWLAEIVYALAFNAASYAGLSAIVALALMALNAIVFIYLRPRVGPLGLFLALAVLSLALLPFMLARPHVIAWVFIAGWTAVLLARRDQGRPPPLALALLMLVWANLHASYIIGFVIAAVIAFDEWIATRFSFGTVRRWLPFGLACLAAAIINANGFDGIIHPLTISTMESLQNIGEWKPSTPDNTPLFHPILVLGLAVAFWRRPKFTVGELILLLGSMFMAFVHIRHQTLFIILAILIVPPRLGVADRTLPLFDSDRERRLVSAGVAAVALVVAMIIARMPIEPKEQLANPRNLIAHVPADLRDRPVFNEYSMGGPLILHGIRPWIDGRADMYGDAHVQDYLKIIDGDLALLEKRADRFGIRWTMVGEDDGLVAELDRSPDWKRLYADDVGVIHVRKGGGPSGSR